MNSLGQLIDFLMWLQASNIHYRLDCVREAVMVVIPTPSKYYEVEFFSDGHIESQTFGPSSPVGEVTITKITDAVMGDLFG